MLGRMAVVAALGLVAFATGCGDDDDKKKSDQDPVVGVDGGSPDGEDGLGGRGMDGGLGLDGAVVTRDGGLSADGAVIGDGGCVLDPRFGCGQQTGSWIRYPNGLEIDLASGLAWAPAQAPSGAHGDDAWHYCQGLSIDGISEFELPTIDQVRTLAAGCADSVVGGSCRVAHEDCIGPECGTGDACKACEAGKGPHASGGYCRPEVGSCVTAWSLSACDSNGPTASCPTHRHWYYDVQTGGFGLSEVGSSLSGRCVARLATTN